MNELKYPFISYLFKRKKINLPIFIIASIGLFFLVLFTQLFYTSQVSILPTAASFSQGMSGNLGMLGQLAGINLNPMSGQSQVMFMGILKSRRLLDKVVNREYEFQEQGQTIRGNLIQIFEIEGENEREVNEIILKLMREDVVLINIDTDNGILFLDVTTSNPFLSADVANYMSEVLNDVVKTEVQKEFHQKLEYLKTKISEIEDSLKFAENDLKKFLEINSDPTTPQFQIEQIRLRRNLEIQTQLFIEFKKQLEIFVADNMVNMADIKILDEAYPPYRKSRPKRILLLITYIGLFAFLQIGVNGTFYIYKKISIELFRK